MEAISDIQSIEEPRNTDQIPASEMAHGVAIQKNLLPLEMWREEILFYDGDSFFHGLCESIDHARESIELETFIFQNDGLGKRVARHLIAAAKRGVKVRVAVDGIGTLLWKYQLGPLLEEAGVQTKVFHSVSILKFLLFPFFLKNFKKVLSRLERRNHRKLCVIDGNIAWVGSMNIVAYHLREFKGEAAWRDTGVRVSGPAVSVLRNAFDASWSDPDHSGQDILQPNSSLVRIYTSKRRQRRLYRDFLHKLDSAQDKIWLTTAYFVPKPSLLKSLRSAAMKNIDIRILTTAKTDVFIIRWIRSIFYFSLLRTGARIFEYKPAILHAKCAIIDDFAMIGSTNLNNRSFTHDLEVDVVLKKPESIRSLERQFLLDLTHSREILKKEWRNRFWLDRLLGKVAFIFRRWL